MINEKSKPVDLKVSKALSLRKVLNASGKKDTSYATELKTKAEKAEKFQEAFSYELKDGEVYKIFKILVESNEIEVIRYRPPGCNIQSQAELPLSLIDSSDYNSRAVYPEERVKEIEKLIEDEGQNEPISVLYNPTTERFEVLDGETRKRAKTNLKHEKISALIFTEQTLTSWLDRIAYSRKQNVRTLANCDFDDAVLAKKAMAQGFSIDQVADKIGKSEKVMHKLLPLADVPPLLKESLEKNGAPFSRHILEKLKRLSKIDDDSAAKLAVVLSLKCKGGEQITQGVVTTLVEKEIERIQDLRGGRAKIPKSKSHPEYIFKNPSTGETLANLKLKRARSGSLALTIQTEDQEHEELIQAVQQFVKDYASRNGFSTDEPSR